MHKRGLFFLRTENERFYKTYYKKDRIQTTMIIFLKIKLLKNHIFVRKQTFMSRSTLIQLLFRF